MTQGPKDGIGREGEDIRSLFSYNIQRLAGVSTQIASMRIGPNFDLTTFDWRVLAVLDFLGKATLQHLASRAGVQKSQMSRCVMQLVERSLILREDHPRDKRSVNLSLTPRGREIVREVLEASRVRNREMLQHLQEEERILLMQLLQKATTSSLAYLRALREGETDPAPPSV